MNAVFCREHYEDAKRRALRLAKIREFFMFVSSRHARELNELRVNDLMEMIRAGLFRPLWKVDAKVMWADAGELKDMKDREHVELLLLYGMLDEAARLPNFASAIDFEFIVGITRNLKSADAIERRNVAGFLTASARRNPELRKRILGHVVLMLNEMSQGMAPPSVASVLGVIRELSTDQWALAVTHLLPLLGNPGLKFFASTLLPWLRQLAADRGFCELLVEKAIRSFPQTNHRSAVPFLSIFEHAAHGVPQRLVKRLLAIVAWGLSRSDGETNAKALGVLRSPGFTAIVDRAKPEDAAPMLERLFVALCAKTEVSARTSCWNALVFVIGRNPKVVREVGLAFHDRCAGLREKWQLIARTAKAEDFSADSLVSDPAVVRIATPPMRAIEYILARCG
jgi:hypothetical protein